MASGEGQAGRRGGGEGSPAKVGGTNTPREKDLETPGLSPQLSVGRAGSPPAGLAPRKKYRRGMYRGVRERSSGKWIAEIKDTATGTRKWLGTHPSAEAAALAFDKGLREIKGDSAQTNFPAGAYLASTDPPRVLIAAEGGGRGWGARRQPPSVTVSAPASTSAVGLGGVRGAQSSSALSLSPSPTGASASASSGERFTTSVAPSSHSQWGARERPEQVERHPSPAEESSALLRRRAGARESETPDAGGEMSRQGAGLQVPPGQVGAVLEPEPFAHQVTGGGGADTGGGAFEGGVGTWGAASERAQLYEAWPLPLDTGQLEDEGHEEGDMVIVRSIDEIERMLMD